MIKHFQADVEKCFVRFYCRTIRLCEAFAVLMFKYDIGQHRNAKWYFLCIPNAVERFGNKICLINGNFKIRRV